jgi:2-dehydro-3-deoxyphosphogluconate aldolase / (4S)-4-hydroxy-2-oxoglutarate aldolase
MTWTADGSDLLDLVPVIPVVTIEDAARATSVARALAAGGVRVVEVTLRSPAALDAIRAIAAEVPDVRIGAGTVCTAEQARAAADAGAQFLVTPGSTQALLDTMQECAIPFLAAVATSSDVLRLLERGISHAKLFPAAAAGGTGLLRALHGPFPQIRFCPTGGITPATAAGYLALPNVACVGGSWLAPPAIIEARAWDEIEQRAAQSLRLRPGSAGGRLGNHGPGIGLGSPGRGM